MLRDRGSYPLFGRQYPRLKYANGHQSHRLRDEVIDRATPSEISLTVAMMVSRYRQLSASVDRPLTRGTDQSLAK